MFRRIHDYAPRKVLDVIRDNAELAAAFSVAAGRTLPGSFQPGLDERLGPPGGRHLRLLLSILLKVFQ